MSSLLGFQTSKTIGPKLVEACDGWKNTPHPTFIPLTHPPKKKLNKPVEIKQKIGSHKSHKTSTLWETNIAMEYPHF